MATLMKREPAGLLTGTLAAEAEVTEGYRTREKADRTRAAYAREWKTFERWCAARELVAKPAQPGTVALFLGARAAAGIRPASLALALSAISQEHRTAGLESPRSASIVKTVMKGIRRTHGTAQTRKQPLLPPLLKAIVSRLPPGRVGARDRALLLMGFAGAFRRSELVSLNVEDLSFDADGLHVRLARSKTDQEGAGAVVHLPFGDDPDTCPVGAARAWLLMLGLPRGPLFRRIAAGRLGRKALTDRAVALIVKRHMQAVGANPAEYAGHSLRRGFATAAAKAGKSRWAIAGQARWELLETADRYIEEAELVLENAAKGIGL